MSLLPDPPAHRSRTAGPERGFSLVPERNAVVADGREVPLTRTQFRLLALLVGEPGRVFSRKELVERGIGARVTERTVDVHVKDLRRKLGEDGALIETVRGRGYRFRGPGPSERTERP